MTRKGELGCPNCDGPCIGCWEMTDTEKRVAEIEAQLDDDTTTCVEIVTNHVGWLLAELRARQAAHVECAARNIEVGLLARKRLEERDAARAECERLRGQQSSAVTKAMAHFNETLAERMAAERDEARAQLAEAVVLLRRVLDTYSRDGMGPGSSRRISAHGDARAFLATVTT